LLAIDFRSQAISTWSIRVSALFVDGPNGTVACCGCGFASARTSRDKADARAVAAALPGTRACQIHLAQPWRGAAGTPDGRGGRACQAGGGVRGCRRAKARA